MKHMISNYLRNCKNVYKSTFSVLLALLVLVACTEKKQHKSLYVTGNIDGLKKGTLYIKKLVDTALVSIDTIEINGNPAFESELDITSPEMLYLVLDRGATTSMDDQLLFFAEPGHMNIDTSLEMFYHKAKITGSKNHELYEQFKKINARFNNQELELEAARFTALQKKQPFSEEAHQKKIETVIKRKYLYAINFAINNKDREVAPYIALSEINQATVKYLDTIQKSLTPKVAKSKYGKLLAQYISERKKLEGIK